MLVFDNAKQHVAKTSMGYLQQLKFGILTGPPYTPEMNPVEIFIAVMNPMEIFIAVMKKKLLKHKADNL